MPQELSDGSFGFIVDGICDVNYPPRVTRTVISPFIQQLFLEHLQCSGHCAKAGHAGEPGGHCSLRGADGVLGSTSNSRIIQTMGK